MEIHFLAPFGHSIQLVVNQYSETPSSSYLSIVSMKIDLSNYSTSSINPHCYKGIWLFLQLLFTAYILRTAQ